MKTFPEQNTTTSTAEDRARIMWRMRLITALRTASACAIVGGAILFGPKSFIDQVKFTAFSYVTVVLILSSHATLGEAISGIWHAFCATILVVPPAVLLTWMVGPRAEAGLPAGMAALAGALASFLVALLPESVHLTAKRIALGQVVLACTEAVVSSIGDDTKYGFMHPMHIAASTGLGAFACVLASLLPFPELAHHKVQRLCQVYAENASERMNLYLKAFNGEDFQTKTEILLQAKPLTETATKLLQSITILQEGITWEKPWMRFFRRDIISPGDKLQSMELKMRAIEYSLVSTSVFPVQTVDQEHLSDALNCISIQLHQKIDQSRNLSPLSPMVTPEEIRISIESPSLPLESIFPIQNIEGVCFFFSCINMFLNDNANNHSSPKKLQSRPDKPEFSIKTRFLGLIGSERLESAIKCSISIGLSVLLGLILERENGCWAGLTVAITFSKGRQPFFTIANTRLQGTAIGSVYGVICCFLFHHREFRFLALLPWVIFTTFLRHSRMYGQSGGVSAALAALLILGRKNYGPPTEFAIDRLTAVFVGLSCFVLVELLMQPKRAATLSKRHLRLTLNSIQDCLKEMGFCIGQKPGKFLEVMREKQRTLESLVNDLGKMATYAELEPDFWYLPFHSSCYRKLIGSLSNVVNVLYLCAYNLERLSELQSENGMKEFLEEVNSEMELFQEILGSLVQYLDKVHSVKSVAEPTEAELRELEEGKFQNQEKVNALITEDDEKDSEKQIRERRVRCVEGAIRFCIICLRKEIDEVEICVKEIILWENHSIIK